MNNLLTTCPQPTDDLLYAKLNKLSLFSELYIDKNMQNGSDIKNKKTNGKAVPSCQMYCTVFVCSQYYYNKAWRDLDKEQINAARTVQVHVKYCA